MQPVSDYYGLWGNQAVTTVLCDYANQLFNFLLNFSPLLLSVSFPGLNHPGLIIKFAMYLMCVIVYTYMCIENMNVLGTSLVVQ